MAKPKTPKQQNKAAKHKKGAKPAEAVEVQAPEAEAQVQAEPLAADQQPDAAIPPTSDARAVDTPVPEAAPAEAATSAEPAPEPAAPVKTKGKKAAKEPKPKKVSALDAAAKVLAESGAAMTTQAMIEAMAAKGYWSSPGGQTPAATLYSGILRELSTKGEQSRFVKTERGKFGLKAQP